jgi:hypothetical protein
VGVLAVEAGEEILNRWGFAEGGKEMAKCHRIGPRDHLSMFDVQKRTRFKPGTGAETGPVDQIECSTDVR